MEKTGEPLIHTSNGRGHFLSNFMKTVITYGTFDVFHVGHVRLLERLRGLGDRLIVGCSTDEFNAKKGKKAIIPYEHRVEILQSCRHVDETFPENDWNQKRADIVKFKADIFAMGDDWIGKFDDLSDLCKVIYLPRTEDISSTEIRQIVRMLHADEIHHIHSAASHVVSLIEAIKG